MIRINERRNGSRTNNNPRSKKRFSKWSPQQLRGLYREGLTRGPRRSSKDSHQWHRVPNLFQLRTKGSLEQCPKKKWQPPGPCPRSKKSGHWKKDCPLLKGGDGTPLPEPASTTRGASDIPWTSLASSRHRTNRAGIGPGSTSYHQIGRPSSNSIPGKLMILIRLIS